MSKENKSKESNEEKNNPQWRNKNYQHAAGEIEALRTILENRKEFEKSKSNNEDDETEKDPDDEKPS